jgi:FlaA1/EpsC-like NDP-sugar epimerase
VLVTGAGGTIGSELSRQIAGLGPKSLVLFERYENALWAVERSVAGLVPGGRVYPVIADVTDEQRVDEVLAEHRPDLILHAAAHKHVPLMELNPCEAIKNNVRGRRSIPRVSWGPPSGWRSCSRWLWPGGVRPRSWWCASAT